MIQNLLKFLPNDNSSLWHAANRLMVMSDSEYIELAYILRKIIREGDYNTETKTIMFRGQDIIYTGDSRVLVTLSKLISMSPYEDEEDAKKKLEVTCQSHKEREEDSHEN